MFCRTQEREAVQKRKKKKEANAKKNQKKKKKNKKKKKKKKKKQRSSLQGQANLKCLVSIDRPAKEKWNIPQKPPPFLVLFFQKNADSHTKKSTGTSDRYHLFEQV